MTYPCIFSVLCEDGTSRVNLIVPNEDEARFLIALIQVCGLPRP